MRPLLSAGPAPQDWRNAVFSQIGNIRMIRTRDWKLNVYGDNPGELYDLRNDFAEFHNLIAVDHYRQTVKDLHARLREWETVNAGS